MPQCCLTLLLSASGKCGESEGNGGVNAGKRGAAVVVGGALLLLGNVRQGNCVCVSLCIEQNWGIESSPRKVAQNEKG